MNTPPKIKRGTELDLVIESLAFGGQGVAHHDGKVVFVRFAIPGQTVRAKVMRVKSGYIEAVRQEVLVESPFAVKPECSHSRYCGGCTLQNLEYSQQLLAKEQQVQDVFERLGGLEIPELRPILGCADIWRYRNKMEFTFSTYPWRVDKNEKDELPFGLGLHIPGRFDRILDITNCHLQQEVANDLLNTIRTYALDWGLPAYDVHNHTGFLRNVIIRISRATGEIMVNLVTSRLEPDKLTPLCDILQDITPDLTSVVNNVTNRKAGVAVGEKEVLLYGRDHIVERLGEFEFEISANSFFQTNSAQAELLYEHINSAANLTGEEVVFDLYCGTGSIGIYLSGQAKSVYGFELIPSAVEDARRNAQRNNLERVQFFTGDLMTLLRSEYELKNLPAPDVIVIDPPRAGMHPNTVSDILELSPARIIYVSCNPGTQARDIQLLCAESYRLIHLQPVDMFPHTPHVENIAVLTK